MGLFGDGAYQINGQYIMQFSFDSKLDYLIAYVQIASYISEVSRLVHLLSFGIG